ncbi:MAG: dihydrofolate synthase/folylpolyglutamate synthase [Alteromonadaceae bacterium]|jgi:dihydrofolate synthase/folylpolyglutamate synthase|tara:strand:+ start:972 stop:2267 length:1296 start_codon:yes stop_codon:yes gene_type:complete
MSENFKSHSPRDNLAQWLCYLETIHSSEIDLGLSRINSVAQRLNIDFSFAKVITVAGTNGKGTTCAFLENFLLTEDKTVAVYSSPHIEKFNERLRISRVDVEDLPLIDAFEKIEKARGDISLTYYEYTTLAAFIILMAVRPEIIILEVGLGGRLDATNIIDADIAVITTIDLDHQAFLGNTRELIGFEKAGILRSQQLAVLGDTAPTISIINYAKEINVQLKVRQQDFIVDTSGAQWSWSYEQLVLDKLNKTNIPQDNVATALMVLHLLGIKLTNKKVNQAIKLTKVAGRTELFKENCDVLLDVAHNPQAARYLAQYIAHLKSKNNYQRVIAVVGMLSDKDISNTLKPMLAIIDDWFIGEVLAPRSASKADIWQQLNKNLGNNLSTNTKLLNCFDNITQAFKMANKNSNETDLIVVFGSFYTVAEIRRLMI